MKIAGLIIFTLAQTFNVCFASTFIDGVNRPEDFMRVGESPWVIAGNLGNNDWHSGGYYKINIDTLSKAEIKPDFSQPMDPAYSACPTPPAPELLSSHGISLKQVDGQNYRFFSVNHGGRESIEVYDLFVNNSDLNLTWRGCVVLPQGHQGNSVAAYKDGFFATVPKRPDSRFGLIGVVLKWLPESGWSEVPNTGYGYDNGILVSPDEEWLYVNEYANKKVHKVSLKGVHPSDVAVRVNFLPDNLRFAPDGSILATGQSTFSLKAAFCMKNMKLAQCQLSTEVAQIDPILFNEAKTILKCRGNAHFNDGTSAIFIGDKLWVSTFKAQSVRIFDANELTGEDVCLNP